MTRYLRRWWGRALLIGAVVVAGGGVAGGVLRSDRGNAHGPVDRPSAGGSSASVRPTDTLTPETAPRIVLAGSLRRTQIDLTRVQLGKILDGSRPRWPALGQRGAAVNLVASERAAPFVKGRAAAMQASAIPAYLGSHPGTIAAMVIDEIDARVRVVLEEGRNPLARGAMSFIVVGDMSFSRHVNTVLRRKGDWAFPFLNTAGKLASYDLTFGNLESSVSSRFTPPPTGTSFVSDPRALRGLKRAGFDAVSLANNHATNFGVLAFSDTLIELAAREIVAFGGGRNDLRAHRAGVFEAEGERIALLGYNTITGTLEAGTSTPGVAYIHAKPFFALDRSELRRAQRDVRREKAAGNFVIVFPHWGVEYTHTPIRDQVTIARALIDAGADAVIGTHAHWVQGMEFYRGKLIAYGLGNFVFDQRFEDEVTQGIALEGLVRDGELVWFNVLPHHIEGLVQPRFLDPRGPEGTEIIRDVMRSGRSVEFGARS